MSLSEIAFNAKTVLFITISSLIERGCQHCLLFQHCAVYLIDHRCLLHLGLVKPLNVILNDLSSLLETTGKRSQRLFQFTFHLCSNRRVRLRNRLGLTTDYIQRSSQGSSLARPEGLAAKRMKFSCIFVLNRSSYLDLLADNELLSSFGQTYRCRKPSIRH